MKKEITLSKSEKVFNIFYLLSPIIFTIVLYFTM